MVVILELPLKNDYWIPSGIGCIFVYITYLKFSKYDKENIKRFENKLFIMGLILLFMSTNLFPWFIFNNMPLSIQFPWRLYAFSTTFFTIVGSIVLVNKHSKKINDLKKYLTTNLSNEINNDTSLISNNIEILSINYV